MSQTSANKFRTNTFLVVIDIVNAELVKRLEAYTCIAARFGFLRNLKNLPADRVVSSAERLCYTYPILDLKTSLSDELLHFSAFLKTEFAERSLDLTTSSTTSPADPKFLLVPALVETSLDNVDVDVVTNDGDDVMLNVESAELRMYKLIVASKMETVFPNTVIA